MHVDLIESLRCPRPHDESQLVVAAGRVVDRRILDGTLGCPTCGAEFKIQDGITRFEIPARLTPATTPDAALGLRLAALLDLTDARGFAILCGAWGAQLDPIQRVSDTPLLLVNPPADYGGEPAGVLLCGDVMPLAASSVRAAALEADMSAPQIVSAVRAVRPGGRVIGPTSLPLPEGIAEVARDDTLWVGERRATPSLVSLARGSTGNPRA